MRRIIIYLLSFLLCFSFLSSCALLGGEEDSPAKAKQEQSEKKKKKKKSSKKKATKTKDKNEDEDAEDADEEDSVKKASKDSKSSKKKSKKDAKEGEDEENELSNELSEEEAEALLELPPIEKIPSGYRIDHKAEGVFTANAPAAQTASQSTDEPPEEGEFDWRADVIQSNKYGRDICYLSKEIIDSLPQGSFAFSPLSLWMCLAAFTNAIEDPAQGELVDLIFARSNTSPGEEQINEIAEQMNRYFCKEDFSIMQDEGSNIQRGKKMANLYALRSGLNWNQAMIERLQPLEIDYVTLEPGGEPDGLNSWIEEKTNGLIKNYFSSPFADDLVFEILNTLYFSAKWTYEFDPANTYTDVFHGKLEDSEVDMMVREEFDNPYTMRYGDFDFGEILELSYVGANASSISLILPKEGLSANEALSDYFGELADSKDGEDPYDIYTGGLESVFGKITLPKFSLNNKLDLSEILNGLGAKSMFRVKKDNGLKNIVEEDICVYVKGVKQKVVVDLDEKGTTAAAVTEMIGGMGGAIEYDTIDIKFNRPFAFIIKEKGVCYFCGVVSDLPAKDTGVFGKVNW